MSLVRRFRRALGVAAVLSVTLSAAQHSAIRADEPVRAAAVDPDGVLRVGANFGVGIGLVLDPLQAINQAYLGIASLIHGTPLIADNGEYTAYLAESYEIVDASTFKLTLREGLTFQDGQPYDAQALADGLTTNRESEIPLTESGILQLIDGFEVVSPTELVIRTSGPYAGRLPALLAGASSMVAAPGSDGSVGAGPYEVESFTPDTELVLRRWDGFFDAASYPLAGITYVNVATGEAAQNALRAGQVDLVSTSPADVDALVASGDFASLVTNNESHYQLALCRTAPPFDQPEIRQAASLAINRDQLNEFVMGGHSEPLTQQWPSASPFAIDTGIPSSGDPDRARELLESVGGYSDPIPFAVYANVQNQPRLLEVVQAQLAEVGLNVEIIPVTGAIKETINVASGGGLIITNVGTDTEKVLGPLLTPTQAFNACDGEDAGLADLMAPLVAGNLTAEDRADAWHAVQQYISDNALVIPLLTQPAIYVYDSTRVQGLRPGTFGLTGATVPSLFVDGVSIIAD